MNTPHLSLDLDAEELAHLGLALAAQGRVEEALRYFKGAVSQAPDNAQANYLLGAHYAQLGMAQRAADFMRHAARIEPELVLASFQAGWLLMGLSQNEAAQACWQPLLALPAQHPLHLMARGLQALLREDFAQCQQLLSQGIEANQALEALNEDMRKVLAELQRRGHLASASTASTTSAHADQAAPVLGLGRYAAQ